MQAMPDQATPIYESFVALITSRRLGWPSSWVYLYSMATAHGATAHSQRGDLMNE